MNKLMYKQKRKANVNKENRDEENKMDKANIIELLKECSNEDAVDSANKQADRPANAGENSKFASKGEHLSSNSIDFIKSIGWMSDKRPFGHIKHYSREAETYQYEQGWGKAKSGWSNGKGYYQKQNYYDYRR